MMHASPTSPVSSTRRPAHRPMHRPVLTPAIGKIIINPSNPDIVFVAALYATVLSRLWAWPMALAAHLFAIAGFLVGLWATRAGTTPFNYGYHRVMLVVFVAGLVLLLTPPVRAALSFGSRPARHG